MLPARLLLLCAAVLAARPTVPPGDGGDANGVQLGMHRAHDRTEQGQRNG